MSSGFNILNLKGGKIGILTAVPERTLSFQTADYTNAGQGILFMNTGADTADAIVQPWEFGVGVGLVLGANAYVDTAGNVVRFDTGEESAAIMLDPRGEILFLAGGVGANPTILMTMPANGNVYLANAAGPQLQNEPSSLTNPTLLPNRGQANNGIGASATEVGLITDGSSKLFISSDADGAATTQVYIRARVTTAPTYGTTRVNVGANDSAVAGFRHLMIANET